MPKEREYDNTDRGVLFVNDKKAEQKEGAPDYRGSLNVEGKEFWVAGWRKTPKSGGATFLSLSINAKDDSGPAQKKGAAKSSQTPGL